MESPHEEHCAYSKSILCSWCFVVILIYTHIQVALCSHFPRCSTSRGWAVLTAGWTVLELFGFQITQICKNSLTGLPISCIVITSHLIHLHLLWHKNKDSYPFSTKCIDSHIFTTHNLYWLKYELITSVQIDMLLRRDQRFQQDSIFPGSKLIYSHIKMYLHNRKDSLYLIDYRYNVNQINTAAISFKSAANWTKRYDLLAQADDCLDAVC